MSERAEVKRDNARAQKNSGRGKIQKGDAVWRDNFVVDYKETNRSFGLNEKVWRKIVSDAFSLSSDAHPVLKVIIGEDNKTRLAIIDWALLEDLVECYARGN